MAYFAATNFAINIDGMARNASTPEILHLSQPSRQGDETKISSGVSQSRRGVDLIETLQYLEVIMSTQGIKYK